MNVTAMKRLVRARRHNATTTNGNIGNSPELSKSCINRASLSLSFFISTRAFSEVKLSTNEIRVGMRPHTEIEQKTVASH